MIKKNKTKPEILLHTIYSNQFQVDQRLKCETQKRKAFRIKNNIFLSSCREGFINQRTKITKQREKLIDFITYKWRTLIIKRHHKGNEMVSHKMEIGTFNTYSQQRARNSYKRRDRIWR